MPKKKRLLHAGVSLRILLTHTPHLAANAAKRDVASAGRLFAASEYIRSNCGTSVL
jgi:hypothetical protein